MTVKLRQLVVACDVYLRSAAKKSFDDVRRGYSLAETLSVMSETTVQGSILTGRDVTCDERDDGAGVDTHWLRR